MKKALGLMDEVDVWIQSHVKSLLSTRDELPYKIIFSIVPSKMKDKEGFIINIRSEPVLLFKMRQLKMRPSLDEFDYSDIIGNNKQFINEIIRRIGAITLENQELLQSTKTPTIEKLDKFGFETIANLLRQGKIKIGKGNTEDGLTDLREALSNFVNEAVRKIGLKPKKTITKDLDTLKELGYIDERIHKVIHIFYMNGFTVIFQQNQYIEGKE